MAQKTYIVEGKQFRTAVDYNLAKKDQKIIEAIRAKVDLQNPKQIEQVLNSLRNGKYRFHTALGKDFEKELEEKLETLKNGGTASKKKGAKKISVDEDLVLKELKRQEKKRKLIVFLCGMAGCFCLGYFALYSYYGYKTERSYEELSALKEQGAVQGGTNGEVVINYTNTDRDVPEVLDEYKNLVNKNKKLIGWVKIDDTNIDYPVMQTENNEYYLDHNLNQEYDKNGSIFLDKDCDVLKPSTNFIIYGHHMRNGKMFGELDLYSSEDYYKEHKYIRFDTIYEKGTYEVMYVFRSKVYTEDEIVFKYYQFIDALSEQEFDSNMREMAALSLYDTGVTAEYGDQLLTLSTCDYYVNDGRFVVVAKKVE